MFSKGDTVVYGNNGLCIIEDVREMNFGGDIGTYYVLKPKSSKASTLYVPLSKENLVSKMRSVLTKDEIDNILTSIGDALEWTDNKAERNKIFLDILSDGSACKLLKMIKCLYVKKEEMQSIGKNLSPGDEKLLKMSEKLINEEFAVSLDCLPEDVDGYIRKKVNG
jgi:CarD family transcriptional regulator